MQGKDRQIIQFRKYSLQVYSPLSHGSFIYSESNLFKTAFIQYVHKPFIIITAYDINFIISPNFHRGFSIFNQSDIFTGIPIPKRPICPNKPLMPNNRISALMRPLKRTARISSTGRFILPIPMTPKCADVLPRIVCTFTLSFRTAKVRLHSHHPSTTH